MPVIKVIRQLIGYVFIGLLPILCVLLLRPIITKKRFKKSLIAVDVMTCVIAHGEFRTISGLTGERYSSLKRYELQRKVIDFIFGDSHCVNAHKWEVDIKYNYFEYFKL